MSRLNTLLTTLFVAIAICVFVTSIVDAAERKPNIVVIFCDDLGY